MFEHLGRQTRRRSVKTLLVSLFFHCGLIGLALTLPLLFFQHLAPADFVSYLTAPPPQPLPPPAPPVAPPERLAEGGRPRVVVAPFTAPTEIPSEIPEAPEYLPEIPSSWSSGITAGVTAGEIGIGPAAGSTSGIWVGSVLSAEQPPPPRPPQTVRRGGDIQSSRLIHRVDPTYPPLAQRARVQGLVVLQATLDEEGRITELKVISGHPLLNEAALSAVRQWRYSPTLLNGEPVRVVTTITVIFRLN